MSITISLLVISALIFFHELGHYLAAKAVGVFVEVFSIGFGPKIASFMAFNTRWQIALIPLGGYVKMKGQDDSDPTKKSYDNDSYNVKTPVQKIFILLSGPLANFILAFFLYIGMGFGGVQILSPVVGEVAKESPAMRANLEANDTIVSINGVNISTWEELAQKIESSSGAIELNINRQNQIKTIIITPEFKTMKNMFGENIDKKIIGISPAGITHTLEPTVTSVVAYATDQTIFASTIIFKGLQKLITGDVPAKELGGVISIVKLTSDASEAGWISVFFFAALISVNLGVLNLLPIPALDGGHIAFNLYELIFKKEVNEEIMIKLTIFGWVVLFGLMGLGLYNDINRLME